MRYLYGFLTGAIVMACVVLIVFNLNTKSNTNKIEHIKTGDIEWVCIDNGDYTRSCDVIRQYQ